MIKKDNVELLAIEKEHINQLLIWINDIPKDRLPIISAKRLSHDNLSTLIKHDGARFYVICTDKKDLIGFIRIAEIDTHSRKASIYVFIDPKTNFLSIIEYKVNSMVLNYCFDVLGVNKIIANILYGNVYLLKLYEKLGFQRDALRRQHHFVNGTYQHVLEMSLLASDIGIKNGSKTHSN